MGRVHCKRLLRLLIAATAGAAFGCGGKASDEVLPPPARTEADGGSSFLGAAGADSIEPGEAQASLVQTSGDNADTDTRATPECLQGFQGFSARLGELTVDFKAFVFEPGSYQGDSPRILWLNAVRANGDQYLAAAGTGEQSGSISLRVVQVAPRFIGSLDALVPALGNAELPALMLSLKFDIAVRADCPE